jgi:YidC/Oxa1 family membrane protein insertase
MSINTNDPAENKRTIIAVVLSVVVITIGFWIQGMFFPTTQQSPPVSTPAPAPAPTSQPVPQAPAVVGISASPAPSLIPAKPAVTMPSDSIAVRTDHVETDLLSAEFSNKGGELVSLKLKKHKEKAGNVDLFVPGTPDVQGFAVAFGSEATQPMREPMKVTKSADGKTIEFTRTLYSTVAGRPDPIPFTYRKIFSFKDGEYLFGMAIKLDNSENAALPLGQGSTAYTLSFGPRIGPSIDSAGQGSDIRKILSFAEGKRKEEKQKNQPWSPAKQPVWTAISGKYFAFVAVPKLDRFETTYVESAPSPTQTTAMSFSRPTISVSSQQDLWYFYFGPITSATLAKYDYPDRNAFKIQDMQLENVLDNTNLLKWLEDFLKLIMNLFYKLVPNYGVSIILLTILVKVAFFPLTKKGSMASARMAELQPKMQELQAKHKNNPQKLNQEMAEFYKKEGYNPMSGCLPLLIQFPLFIAMYNLFNTHFDLRGASFIPGWIPDLSVPESVWNFGGFQVPLLGWTDLRLLPILYVGSQLLYGKFTQMPQTGQSANQMKLMMYGMPIVFFFMLYDVPSGLLVYWIAQNVLTIFQQIIINDYIKAHKAKVAAEKLGKR